MRRIPSNVNRLAPLPLYILINLRCLSTGTFRGTANKLMKIRVSEFTCVRIYIIYSSKNVCVSVYFRMLRRLEPLLE